MEQPVRHLGMTGRNDDVIYTPDKNATGSAKGYVRSFAIDKNGVFRNSIGDFVNEKFVTVYVKRFLRIRSGVLSFANDCQLCEKSDWYAGLA